MFDAALVEIAAIEKEVELTTFGRKTGTASRRIIWITALDGRLFIRSGMGLDRDWPRNLVANGRATLHMAGRDIAVRARHVTEPAEARAMHAPIKQKYDAERPASTGGEPLLASEQAVFELTPE